MGTRIKWLASLLIAGFVLTPTAVQAQTPNVGEPYLEIPVPLMWGEKETGFYFAAEALWWRLDNPIGDTNLAIRGFVDEAGQASSITIINPFPPPTLILVPGPSGAFQGSGDLALKTGFIQDTSREPGYRFTIGYRFRNALAVEYSHWWLAEFRHAAGAGIMPEDFNVDDDFASSFLFAPFYNFTPFFAGPTNDVTNLSGTPVPAFGIWNAAEDMTIQLTQNARNDEVNFRMPITQNDCIRTYALAGVRYFDIEEIFKWRTVDLDVNGVSSPQNTATYENHWYNRLYGAQWGGGSDVYLGNGFAFSIDARIGVFADVARTYVKLLRGDLLVAPQKARNETNVSPMGQVGAYLYWYPIEGVQIRAGYEFLSFWNVVRAEHPVDFNLGTMAPDYDEHDFMYFDGWTLGFSLTF